MPMTKTRESDSPFNADCRIAFYDLASGEGIGWKDPRRRVPDADGGGVPARRPFPWRKHVLMTVLVGKPPDRVPFHPIRGTFSQFEKPKRMSAGDFLYQNRHQNVFW